jgi:hypothetical protein
MTTQNTGIGAITLRTMRARLDEAAAIARAAEGCAMDGQPGRALIIALGCRAAGRGGERVAAGAGDPEPDGA